MLLIDMEKELSNSGKMEKSRYVATNIPFQNLATRTTTRCSFLRTTKLVTRAANWKSMMEITKMTSQPAKTHAPRPLLLVLCLAALVLSAGGQSPSVSPWPNNTAAGDPNINRTELDNFYKYMDSHPDVARELRNDPNLINNPNWLAQHPSTQQFLANHPGVSTQLRDDPGRFVNREERFQRDGDYVTRRQAASADNYLDQHPEIAQQLRQNPKLIDNPNYLAAHPSLQNYLQNHPEVRQDWKQHPYAFEKREKQYEKHEYKTPSSRYR